MNREIPKIQVTHDYDRFTELLGNRDVKKMRVSKILKSIKAVGYIPCPIIVNENYEVIDGQARLTALKTLNLPIYYIVIPGLGLEECISMNMYQTNWSTFDYVTSYADTGNISYAYLKSLILDYRKYFKDKVIMYAATGKVEQAGNSLKEGRFQCTDEEYRKARRVLTWLINFKAPIDRNQGHNEYYYMGLIFCYGDPEVDNDRLLKKINELQANFIPVTTIQQALDVLESIYNNRSRKTVYIKTNYRKYMEGRYSWYDSKYGDRYQD